MGKNSKAARKPRSSGRQHRKDKAPSCGCEKHNGDLCLREAGWGTDHPGEGPCKFHAGAVGAAAVARKQLESMGQPVDVTPAQAMQGLLNLAAGQLAYCTAMVGGLEEEQMFEPQENGPPVPNRWVRLQLAVMDKVRRASKAAADMGVAERQTQVAELQTGMMATVLEAVMDKLELTPAQRKGVGPAIRSEMPKVLEAASRRLN